MHKLKPHAKKKNNQNITNQKPKQIRIFSSKQIKTRNPNLKNQSQNREKKTETETEKKILTC